jgi:hypothetical protein
MISAIVQRRVKPLVERVFKVKLVGIDWICSHSDIYADDIK